MIRVAVSTSTDGIIIVALAVYFVDSWFREYSRCMYGLKLGRSYFPLGFRVEKILVKSIDND